MAVEPSSLEKKAAEDGSLPIRQRVGSRDDLLALADLGARSIRCSPAEAHGSMDHFAAL
jgi:hypothetical protein